QPHLPSIQLFLNWTWGYDPPLLRNKQIRQPQWRVSQWALQRIPLSVLKGCDQLNPLLHLLHFSDAELTKEIRQPVDQVILLFSPYPCNITIANNFRAVNFNLVKFPPISPSKVKS